MIKTPCELTLWDFHPAVRREMVKKMVKSGMKRKDVARIFDMSEAAICQYLKSKRGTNFKFGKGMREQIGISTEKIANSGKRETVISEICRICSLLKRRRAFCNLHHREDPLLNGCKLYKTVCLGKR